MSKISTYISFGISQPKDLVIKIDKSRGDIPRSKYIQRIIEQFYKQREEKMNKCTIGNQKISSHDCCLGGSSSCELDTFKKTVGDGNSSE